MTTEIPRHSSALMRSIEMVKGDIVFGYIQNIDPDLSTGEYFVAERLMVYSDRMNINQWKNGAIKFDVYVFMRKNNKEFNNKENITKDDIVILDHYEGCMVRDGSSIKDAGQFGIGEKVEIGFESRNETPAYKPTRKVTKEIGNEDFGDGE